jgi:hypothetical protein
MAQAMAIPLYFIACISLFASTVIACTKGLCNGGTNCGAGHTRKSSFANTLQKMLETARLNRHRPCASILVGILPDLTLPPLTLPPYRFTTLTLHARNTFFNSNSTTKHRTTPHKYAKIILWPHPNKTVLLSTGKRHIPFAMGQPKIMDIGSASKKSPRIIFCIDISLCSDR